ncbi:MAG: hypothetical protein ISS14_06115 [Actinobacteria bacterium]|nr:hypothetical protein [Actinomycetota bacterium]
MNPCKDYKEIFGNININPYSAAAKIFLPDKIKVLFIFESPPFPPPMYPITKKENPEWSYFYRFGTKGSNALRREVCTAVFNKTITDHKEFLNEFSTKGYFLIDAVNYPINKIIEENKYILKLNRNGEVDPREREGVIFCEAGELVNTIEYWVNESDSDMNEIKILLVKVSVFNGLMFHDNPFKKLVDNKKYNVLNTDTIPYPMVPHNIKFRAKVREYLNIKF